MSVLKEKAKVIMLPTEKVLKNGLQPISAYSKPINKSGLIFPTTGSYARRLVELGNQAYHLYIISDEEIKKGDYVYVDDINFKGITQVTKVGLKIIYLDYESVCYGKHENKCKKIIATTNTSLVLYKKDFHMGKSLPQPPKGFIKKYIEEYNKGNIIIDILVKRETCWSSSNYVVKEAIEKTRLKVSKNNTITIYPVKDNWNREELIPLFSKILHDAKIANYYNMPSFREKADFENKWIENNL